MSLPRFFLDSQRIADEQDSVFKLDLSDDDFHHFRVLRLELAEHIAIIDASSDYFECKIENICDEGVFVSIARHESIQTLPARVTLYQALPKQAKFDDVIRHATEIGVDAFQPFISRRCVVKLDGPKAEKRVDRWRGIAKSAAMQSGRCAIPDVRSIASFDEAMNSLFEFDLVLIFWEESSDLSLKNHILNLLKQSEQNMSIAVIVGSEGGFEKDEVERMSAASRNAHVVSLGNTILRTETAGIIAPALVIYELGGLGNMKD